MAVDDRDWPGFRSLFTPDAELITRAASGTGRADEVLTGLEQIERVSAMLERFERTFHLLGQSTYLTEDDRATGTVYCQAHHFWTDDSGGHNLVMYIRYHDGYERGNDGDWRFRSRDVHVDWTERRNRKDG
jgi:hypothetical protein